jgi:hypothetical protein
MSERREIKVIKKADLPDPKAADEYIRSHELSMLHLLVKKYPEITKQLAEKVCCKPQ